LETQLSESCVGQYCCAPSVRFHGCLQPVLDNLTSVVR